MSIKFFKLFVFTSCVLTLSVNTFSQDIKRTNNWYFGLDAGVEFNSGEAVALYDGKMYDHTFRGNTTMSDTNGNLLFYTNGWHLWNKNHVYMTYQFLATTQQVISFPFPGADHLYYVFSVPYYNPPANYYFTQYGIVDMSMNGGLGGVSGNITTLDAAWDAAEQITAVKHKNKQDVWVVTRKYTENKYASFLVNQFGVNTNPVLSPAPVHGSSMFDDKHGEMRISYDKEYLILCNMGSNLTNTDWIEVCKFNDESGEVDYLYSLQFRDPNYPYELWPFGVEFSPDSKFLYVAFSHHNPTVDKGSVYQFNVQDIEDSASFVQSAVEIGHGNEKHGLQLASDGKIYVTAHATQGGFPWLGVIHKPWVQGAFCQYENEGVYLDPGETSAALPNYLPDYLYRFDFEGTCEGESYQFTSFFHPEPVNILWNFSDPASGSNTSTELNPVHVFSDGGIYEVSVHVEYPNGRIEETSRKVEVEYAPEPDLGPDTTFCTGGQITLDAECGPHDYTWNTGVTGSSQIIVSDTGWYWVRVENDAGCFAIDSIHLSFLPPTLADTANLEVIPTTCGDSTGVIKGIVINGTPPLSYQWLNDLGNPISNALDIYHLPVGNYTLEVTDGNGCISIIDTYSIIDAGNVLIDSVDYTIEHCGQQDATINITAISGLSAMLFYSIDDGLTFHSNQGFFTNLSAGTYAVRVRDSLDCHCVYVNNPIIIPNTDAPEITNVQIGACSPGQSNGSIEISASGSGDTLYYSNDNGINFQVNDGGFFNLDAGYYTCVVEDEVGCDTTFIVEVPEEVTIQLQAQAGADEVCPGNAAFVPLQVCNFNDVASFETILFYNKTILTCTGFANAHALLEDSLEAQLFPTEGKIQFKWSSAAISLPDDALMVNLVFESVDPGISLVEWDGSIGASFFQNSTGLNIPVDYHTGNVKIYKEVSLSLNYTASACQGDTLKFFPMLTSANGDVSWLWTDPIGDTSSYFILTINNIQQNQSGTYSLLVTDTVGCYAEVYCDVLVYPTPIPAFAGQDTITTEDPIELDGGNNYLSYLWNTGDTVQHITAGYDDWYSVYIESQQGCFGEDSVYVLFWEPPQPPEPIYDHFHLPNAFTPDGDGLNDEFKVIGAPDNITSFNMYIFNRWGQMVFESKDVSLGWDGTFNGGEAPVGTYAYKLMYSINAYDFTRSGTVVLIR
ncbi:MAG: gliding motility-associated C-terminal domain-containing protein [Bacteroidota bacterium]